MGLLSFLQRDKSTAPAKSKSGATDPDDVQQLRIRARRRLIGAAVLVAVGVIGFPMIFETQPRPIPVDLPIEIPKKDAAPALAVPAAPVAEAMPPRPAVEPSAPPVAPVEKVADKPAEKAVDKPLEKVADKPAEKPVDPPAVKTPDKSVPKSAAKGASQADSARIQALLEGREPAAKTGDAATATPRFIVQVGAFAENKAAQEMRTKVEKLGFKTYAQAVQTPEGQRIRVRVGTFPSREEASKVAAKLHAAGLAGTVLTL